MNNYTVIVKLEVRAEDEGEAENKIRPFIESAYKAGGIGPVSEFQVTEGAYLLDKVYKDIHDMPG